MSHRVGSQRMWVCLLLAILPGAGGCGPQQSEVTRSPSATPTERQAEPGIVTIVLERPGEEPLEQEVAVTGRQTVVEVMQASTLDWQMSGSGSTALVKSIAGLPMEAGQGWIYRINGQWATRGIGQTEVLPGDEIRWQYGRFDALFEAD